VGGCPLGAAHRAPDHRPRRPPARDGRLRACPRSPGEGARRDLGQAEAAVVLLQDPAKRTTAKRPWAARLWYAYADALLAAGRTDEAREWFSRVAEIDADGETDAVDRLLELDGVVLDEEGGDLPAEEQLPGGEGPQTPDDLRLFE
jgi:hypothetical protein